MDLKNISEKQNDHAFLSPSKYHWLNYSDDKLLQVYANEQLKQLGTVLHDFASRCINMGYKLELNEGTVNRFVNDCIELGLKSEQLLFYSEYCYGTADAIKFDGKTLSIFDLKTGRTKASYKQLAVYAAIFCMSTKTLPTKIAYDLRIYQNEEVIKCEVDSSEIQDIIKKIKKFDKLLRSKGGD